MVHTVRDRAKLLNRVRRIRGQVSAIEGLVEEEAECERVLQTIAACRGAINGLMAEVLEDHVRFHVLGPDTDPTSEQGQAAEQLLDLVRSYLK
ncbi:MAG TPA: metal/formaldehyde-sensitive transcriptional repressor [Gemmatimonadales bacterium]|nr:metal/formaldehyde-sensitive transcriptional repressor [Gemmatimonadales bacterium]